MQSYLTNILFFSLIKNPADRADLKQLMASLFILKYTLSSCFQALTPKDLHVICLDAPFHQGVWSRGSRLRWMAVQHHWLESACDPNTQCKRVTIKLIPSWKLLNLITPALLQAHCLVHSTPPTHFYEKWMPFSTSKIKVYICVQHWNAKIKSIYQILGLHLQASQAIFLRMWFSFCFTCAFVIYSLLCIREIVSKSCD